MLDKQDKKDVEEIVADVFQDVMMPALKAIAKDQGIIKGKLNDIDNRLDTIETKLDQMDRKLDWVTQKTIDHEANLNEQGKRLVILEQDQIASQSFSIWCIE